MFHVPIWKHSNGNYNFYFIYVVTAVQDVGLFHTVLAVSMNQGKGADGLDDEDDEPDEDEEDEDN